MPSVQRQSTSRYHASVLPACAGYSRLPRDVGDIQWMVWVRDLAIAKTVADPELIWVQRDDGVKQCRVLIYNFGTASMTHSGGGRD